MNPSLKLRSHRSLVTSLVVVLILGVGIVNAESRKSVAITTKPAAKSSSKASPNNRESKSAATPKKRNDRNSKPENAQVAAKRKQDTTSALNAAANKNSKRHSADTAKGKDRSSRTSSPRRHNESITRERSNDERLRDNVREMIAKDDLSGEDPEIRRVAVNALGNHAGTVVVMDPRTGRIHSMVNQEWAVREGFKPCSTIKLLTALAGLNEEVIDPDDTSNISHSNEVSLTKALAYSKNEYFQRVGGQLGFDKMLAYAKQFGLGEKTGINMRNEFAGRLPEAKDRPGIARMSSHGDDFQVTALQLATLVSAMSNGGKLVTPYVVRSRQDELKVKTRIRRQVRLLPEAWTTMVPGMVGAVNYGSGYKARDPRQTVAGKTGTCIEQGGGWVGLFTSYAPLTNPKLAVVVIARGSDGQNHLPAAVAGRIYRELDDRNLVPANTNVAASKPRLFSDDDVNAMSNRTQLRRPMNVTVQPVIMQYPRRTVESVEAESAERTNSEGQTRPRRVGER